MKNEVEKSEKTTIQSGTPGVTITPIPGRPKVYLVTLHLGKIAGRSRVQKRTITGLAAARKAAAEMAANKGQTAARAGQKRARKSLTLSDALERYLRSGRSSWAPKTYTTKNERLHRYLIPFIGSGTDIAEITPLQLQSFQDSIQERLAATTCKQIMVTVGAFFSQLVSWNVITENPCRRLTTIKAKAKQKKIWTPAQVEAVLGSEDCPLFLRLLLVAGCRPEELQALTWSNVDFSQSGIFIRQVGYYDTDRKAWKVREGAKTQSSIRFIPLDNRTMEALEKARKLKSGPWVIPADRGGIVAITTLRQRLKRWTKSHGLPAIALYALRHSSITYLLEAGVMVKTVAARAGHSNTATTLAHYATVTDSAARAAAEAFEFK